MSAYLREIPEIFYSSETGAPIKHCKVCNEYLLDGTDYVIEKSMVHYPSSNTTDLIYEFAICMDCMEKAMAEYSKESQQKMNQYFLNHMNFERQRDLIQTENFDYNEWLSECLITGKAKEKCSQFQICAQCVGGMMVFEHTPFLISGEAMDEVIQLLSHQTLGAMNDFRDRHFPPPEDLSPLFYDKDFVLI